MSYETLTAAPSGGVASQSVVTFAYPRGRTREDYESRGAALSINYGEYKFRQSSGVFSLTYGDSSIRLFWGGSRIAADKLWTLRVPLTRDAEACSFAYPRKLQVVATRGAIMGGQANSGTTMTRGEHRMKVFFGPQPCRDVRLVFTNFVAGGAAAEGLGPNAITVEAAIETITPAAFATVTFGGDNTVVIQPGAVAVSDPIPLDFDANAQAWIRTGVTVTLGQSWPRTSFFAISGEAQIESTNAASQIQATGVLTNGASGSTATAGYIPTAIIGIATTPFPSIGLLGDSIMAGTVGDTSSATTGARGVYMRGLFLDDGTVLPYSVLARASERAEWNIGASGYRRRSALDYCTHVISNYGTNDIAAGTSVANIQTYLTSLWTSAKRRNVKVYQALILPRTDAGNTTPASGFAVGAARDQVNTWIRAQAAAKVIDGIIDVNAVAEGVPGLWASNSYTTDGTHPNATGSVAIAAAVRAVASTFSLSE